MWKKNVFIIKYLKQLLIILDGTQVIVKDTEIQTVCALQGLKACGVCYMYIIVVLANDDGKQVKFVRYSDSNEKQSILFHDSRETFFYLVYLCF